MTKTTVTQATKELIREFLSRRLRQQDVNEHVLLSGQRVQDSLEGIDLTKTRVCLGPDGSPLVLWGLAEEYAWLIATEEAEHYALSIQRHWKKELSLLAMWLGPGRPLWALTLRHTTNRRWHQALGFEVHHEDHNVVLYRRDFEWVS